MFEAYLNTLRLQRRRASDLEPADFRHAQTVRDPKNTLATYSGWALWVAGYDDQAIALAWPWGLIQRGIPAIDPLQIQSNLLLLGPDDHVLPQYSGIAVLVHVVNRLEWHMHAREACGEHYQ